MSVFEAINSFDPATITHQEEANASAILADVADSVHTRLLSKGSSNPKTTKSDKLGTYLTSILYIAPHTIGASDGCGNVCSKASAGCIAGCLYRAGNPVYLKGKERTRLARKRMFFKYARAFFIQLVKEIRAHVRRCRKLDRIPCIRLNGTSDIAWERIAPWLFKLFPDVQFYDYTKDPSRLGNLPPNYHLTLSRSENNRADVLLALREGHKVAVVVAISRFRQLPETWNGYRAADGDTHDLTFIRPEQVILLRAKGPARKDASGFVDQRFDNSLQPLLTPVKAQARLE